MSDLCHCRSDSVSVCHLLQQRHAVPHVFDVHLGWVCPHSLCVLGERFDRVWTICEASPGHSFAAKLELRRALDDAIVPHQGQVVGGLYE
jgi:hypothetical protein